MNLRPYQIETCDKIRASWAEFSKTLAVLPTGSGKTIIAAHISREWVNAGKRVLFLAHREELLLQTLDKFKRAANIHAELEKAEFRASLSAPVVVGSVQTFSARGDRWPENHFDLIIVDECHHVPAVSYRKILQRFDSHAKVLGITASADRADKKNLGEYFDNVAIEVGMFDLIHQGYLSRISIKSIPLQIDLTRVKQTAGDYDVNDLGDALSPYLGAIAEAIKENAGFRKTLCFLPLIATSKRFVAECKNVGIIAEHVDGYCENRKEILRNFAQGKYDLLSNAMLVTEGFDDPSIDCVSILRPTRSRPLHQQMVGRGTRIAPGKENLLLLDFLWLHTKHNLVRPAHLIAKTQEEAEVITKIAEEESKSGGQGELDLEGLATAATEKRHEALRKKLEENLKKKGKLIDAMEYAMREGKADLVDYEPVMKWESHPVTEPQARALKRNGIDPASVTGKGHAMRLLDVAFGKQKLILASEGQRRVMRRMGCENWENATQEEARRFFGGLRRKAA